MTAVQVSASPPANDETAPAAHPASVARDSLERDLRVLRRKLLSTRTSLPRSVVRADLAARLTVVVTGYALMFVGGALSVAGAALSAVGIVSLLASWFHDAVHNNTQGLPAPGARAVARLAAAPLAFSFEWWKIKHVRLHHGSPGDPRFDPDINFVRFLRVTDSQPFFPQHRFQHLYFWLLLPFAAIMAAKPKEILDAHRYFQNRAGSGRRRELVRLTLYKYLPFVLFWAPVLHYARSWTQAVLSFGVFAATAGLLVSCVTQVQHNTTVTVQYDGTPTNQLSYQLLASSDVASSRRIWWWLSGGTCFHAIHHVAPSLSFLELRTADVHLRTMLRAHNLTVPSHGSFWRALASHMKLLHAMSSPSTTPNAPRVFNLDPAR